MDTDSLKLHSPCTPSDCIARLTSAIDKEPTWSGLMQGKADVKPVIGRVTGSSVYLRKRIEYRNSFQVFLRAEVQPEGAGSILVGSFGMHPFVRVFMGCWFAGVFCFGGLAWLGSLAKFATSQHVATNHDNDAWMGLAIPPLMILFGTGLLCLGRYLARNDKRFIIDFLTRTLSAEG